MTAEELAQIIETATQQAVSEYKIPPAASDFSIQEAKVFSLALKEAVLMNQTILFDVLSRSLVDKD